METLTHCLICRSKLTGKTHLVAKDYLYSGQTFVIEKCCTCNFLFTNPRPDANEIKKYYSSEEYISHTDRKKNIQEHLYHGVKRLMLYKKIRLINKYKKEKPIHLLDYGCGTGSFVIAAQKSGYISTGYEPDEQARSIAIQKGAHILSKKEDVFKENPQKYDVITLWHVLEHLHDFPQILHDFYTVLNKGGVMAVALPMANSTDALYYKKHWAALDPPRHLYHFTPETIMLACKKTGFKLLNRKGMTFDSYYISLLSEKHKESKTAVINAVLIGGLSNIKAMMQQKPWSSEIFVFEKTE